MTRWTISSGGVETASASANTWSGGVMWSVAPASRLTGQRMAQVDAPAVDLELAADERVVAEQALDDPQVEVARDVLRVLEPVLERAVARDVLLVPDVVEQLQVLGDLVLGLDGDEAVEHELALEEAAAEPHDLLVEAHVGGAEQAYVLVDRPGARLEVDRRPGDRQRVHVLRVQRRVDRREPAALAVADEVDRAADVLDGALGEPPGSP